MRALLSVANRDGISPSPATCWPSTSRSSRPTARASTSPPTAIEVRPVSELTGLPPLIGGQVKTFHPAIYAGILARRDIPAQMDELEPRGSARSTSSSSTSAPSRRRSAAQLVPIDEAIEMIDVGGAALLGAAARNGAGVAAVGSPEHYPKLVTELKRHHAVSAELRAKLAADAFGALAAYYAEIAAYLNQISNTTFPKRLAVVLEKVDDLRYGENPHQRAAFYRETTHRSGTLADATQIRGERPSFNNYLDLDTAYRIARDFTAPTVAIVKHTDPVGIASDDELVEAYRHALETDSVAAFGGIVGVNREMDGATAREIAANSYEAVVAPSYSQAALGILQGEGGPGDPGGPAGSDRGHARLRHRKPRFQARRRRAARREPRRGRAGPGPLQVVTKRRPTLDELNDLLFAWRSVCHVRSNAIVLARNGATIGIGAAQASRQVSVEIALRRAGDRSQTAVMASDAYFPFPDGIQIAAQAGVTAIIQPGGSIRDEMAIEVADRHHLAMVFTGRRHFRH